MEADNLHHLGQGVYHEKAVYHLNFMAKQDIADTEPQLFFAELIQTTEYIAVTSVRRIDPIPSPSGYIHILNIQTTEYIAVISVCLLVPSVYCSGVHAFSLYFCPFCNLMMICFCFWLHFFFFFFFAEKADTLGCLYCQDLHVHHPQTRLAYQDGRGELWEVLLANFTKLRKQYVVEYHP